MPSQNLESVTTPIKSCLFISWVVMHFGTFPIGTGIAPEAKKPITAPIKTKIQTIAMLFALISNCTFAKNRPPFFEQITSLYNQNFYKQATTQTKKPLQKKPGENAGHRYKNIFLAVYYNDFAFFLVNFFEHSKEHPDLLQEVRKAYFAQAEAIQACCRQDNEHWHAQDETASTSQATAEKQSIPQQ